MSGDLKGGIPNGARKVIQNIKEIARNHTDDEIYAMLKECSMDPNETAQKLLYQDTFHEVKRKRDRRKESVSNKEPIETTRWRPGMQGRGGRGVKGSYSSRYISNDTSGGRNTNAGKENGVNHSMDLGITSSSLGLLDTDNKATIPVTSSITGTLIGPTDGMHGTSTHGGTCTSVALEGSGVLAPKETSAADSNKTWDVSISPADMKSSPTSAVGGEEGQFVPNTEHFQFSMTPPSISGLYSSVSDPVLVPCLDSRIPGMVGAIKREVGSQRTVCGQTATVTAENMPISQDSANALQINKKLSCDSSDPDSSVAINEKVSSEMGNSMHGVMPVKTQDAEKEQPSEAAQTASLGASGAFGSKSSSNYSSRSQPLIGSQKVAPSKEWKPKPVNPNIVQASSICSTSDSPLTVEPSGLSQLASGSHASLSEERASKLQKNLEELHLSSSQHVIIPKHLRVPEAERTGLSFGSFDAAFVLRTGFTNDPDSDNISTPLSESSQGIEEMLEEPSSSIPNPSPVTLEGDYRDHPCSPKQVQDNLSPVGSDVPSSSSPTPDYDQSKPETVLPPGGPQYSVVHTTPNYSTFGLMPPMLSNQLTPTEAPEAQVQQPFDPSTSYYTQFFRPGTDGDGRFSPFLAPGTTSKYNGNIGVLPSRTGQSPPESGSSLVLSTASPTLVTQAAGVMQSSISAAQQPLPVFRQPAGLHISHYPPNYLPYSQYFSPYYVPPPAIHHFLGNAAFPQQSPAGSMFPPPGVGASTAIKYPPPQYKTGTNTSNAVHIGLQSGYGPFSSSPSVTTGISSNNEDLSAAPQYKESNIYITGQQSEGSAVWIPASGRDIPSLQAGSFYNLSPQGQHLAFAPAQASHSTFTGIYHPAQTVPAATVHPLLQQPQTMSGPVEIVGPPPTGVYQQPQQRPQINWANSY